MNEHRELQQFFECVPLIGGSREPEGFNAKSHITPESMPKVKV